MKYSFFLLLCCFSLNMFAQSEAAEGEGMSFVEMPFDELLAQAKEENKVIFIDAYTTWCGPCKMMAAKVFPAAEVGEVYNERFINAKFDMEKGEGPAIAQRYSVRVYPTYLFVDGNGDIVHKGIGYIPQEEFLALADAAIGESSLGVMNKRYDGGDRSGEFLAAYSQVLTDVYEQEKAGRISSEYLEMQKDWSAPATIELLIANPGELGGKRMNYLVENADKAMEIAGASSFVMTMQQAIVGHYMKENNMRELPAVADVVSLYEEYGGAMAPRLLAHYTMLHAEQVQDNDDYVSAAVKYYTTYGSDNAMELNGVAWTIFESSNNEDHLQQALAWAKMSVEMEPAYANMDTLAWLYYKTGDKKMAKSTAMKAIELAKIDGQDYSETEKILEK
ncbi:thioredoxin family protein [Lewinella cohaerens]|uniref:thioredoxin family protein n=1 Tax=Lewinella cohaerens TaxID=70995 RepID=UPI0005C62DAC|nr:thioredoxin domain-containing protein [Lewinella cohaerens]